MYHYSISFAGAGRVGEALCRELYRKDFKIDIVVSENETTGKPLADSCKADWSHNLSFPESTKVIIVAVPDKKIKSVLESITCNPDTLVAHTAGSFGLEIFPEKILKRGIFYPLQTFSKGRNISFNDLPFLLEASDAESSVVLKTLAEAIGGRVHFVDTEQRRILHMAAVFVCNFTNHMLTLGKNVASKADFPFELLVPLIKETISKAIDSGPENSQTGPAIRNDRNTIEKHLELLSYSTELQRVYAEITESIIKYYRTNG